MGENGSESEEEKPIFSMEKCIYMNLTRLGPLTVRIVRFLVYLKLQRLNVLNFACKMMLKKNFFGIIIKRKKSY
jgi:hypothetical protein